MMSRHLLIVVSLLWSSCALAADPLTTSPVPDQEAVALPNIQTHIPPTAAAAANPQALAQATDAQVLGVVMALLDQQVALSQMAKSNAISSGTMTYADLLANDQAVFRARLLEVAAANQSGIQPSLQGQDIAAATTQAIQQLAGLRGEEFEVAFLDTAIRIQADAVKRLDVELLPRATETSLREHLVFIRDRWVQHAQEGQRVQARPTAVR